MPLASLADARADRLPGIVGRPLAVPSRGSTQLAVWALEIQPGPAGQPHSVDREEVFVLQHGQAVGTIADERHQLSPGDALIVPPDTPFSITVTGDQPAWFTVCTTAGIRATMNGATIDPPWAQ